MQNTLKIKLLRSDAIVPRYAHPGEDAAFDLFATEPALIPAGKHHRFMVGIASEFPSDYFLKLEGKSGLAYKQGIVVLGGVIDSGYRDEWGVIVFNAGSRDWQVAKGDMIAQGILLPKPHFAIEVVTELAPSARGTGGFGSTGR